MIKSLVLGSAAGLIALSGAQAADLPVKAKAVEYVKICSLYGAGFYYIPGTDTCIKLGGYVRVDTTFNSSGVQGSPTWSGDSGQGNRYRNYFVGRSRLALTVDTRTATEHRPRHRPQLKPADDCRRRLCRGRVPVHPVRWVHLR
jgi:hypothetical protein